MNSKKYRKTFWPNNIVIKTGCSFNCLYCDNNVTQGKLIKQREISDIIDEIKIAIKHTGTKVFFLSDPCISYPLDYIKEFFRAVIKSNIKIQFCTTIEPVKNCFDDDFFNLYKKAGGIFAILGTETLSSKMLTSYQKPFDKQDIIEWSKLAGKNKLKFGLELLFGGPGEDNDTIKETLDCLSSIEFSLLMYSIGIRVLPNTKLEEIAINEGLIKNRDELFFPKFYVSNEIDISRATMTIDKEIKKYSKRNIRMLPVLLKNQLAKKTGIIMN